MGIAAKAPAAVIGDAGSAHRYDVLGVPMTVTSVTDAVRTLMRWAEDDVGRLVCVRDVHGLMLSLKDEGVRAAHEAASMITPDGMPLALVGRLRGLPVQRTPGADLMDAAMAAGRVHGIRHYLYGGDVGVAEQLKARLEAKYPGVQIVGTFCPPFRKPTAEEDAATRQAVADCGAHLVWVGLSTPKQEYWMLENYRHMSATLLGVGAAYDFLSGRKARAPMWMRNHGLEWLHRLVSEPKRLWRRYLVLAPKFLFFLMIHAIRGKS